MTKENFVSINVVMDRSGSMQALTKDTIGGFNAFLKEQKEVPGEAVFSLAMFSDTYELVADCVPLADVQELNEKTYRTGGMTALLDAIGKTIDATGAKLAAMKEEDRPSKVLFLIMTDGEENSSKEYVHAKVMEKINHQRDKYNWQFVFIGANQDAIQTGATLGVSAANSYNYAASAKGTDAVYASMSAGLRSYRLEPMGASFNMADPMGAQGLNQQNLDDQLKQQIQSAVNNPDKDPNE